MKREATVKIILTLEEVEDLIRDSVQAPVLASLTWGDPSGGDVVVEWTEKGDGN